MTVPFRGRVAPWVGVLLAALSVAGRLPAEPAKPDPGKPVPLLFFGGIPIWMGPRPAPPSAKSDAVLLTPEKYRELLEKIERLQAQLDAAKPARPRSCELEGRVEVRGTRPIVKLKATFKFSTAQPRTVVLLGCQKAQATEAKWGDGKTPLLSSGEGGLSVEVEAAGDHVLTLELDAPLTTRGPKGGELGFEIGLPGAPITALSFEAPASVRRYALATKAPRPVGFPGFVADADAEQAEADRFQPGKGGVPLGPVTYLALSWDDPQRKAEVVRSADADIAVTIGAEDVATVAKLRLRGAATEWRFTAPANADVSVSRYPTADAPRGSGDLVGDRAPNLYRPEPGQTVWRLEFREPPTSDLLVTVAGRVVRPKAVGPIPVGPVAVLNVPRQTGVIRVRAPDTVRAAANLRGETTRESDDAGEQVYRYTLVGPLTAAPPPPVELTLVPLPGSVAARVRHDLRLTESGWRLRAEIALSPSRTAVEYLDVDVPADFQPTVAEPREIVEGLTVVRESAESRTLRLRLTAARRAAFSVTLEGEYPVAAGVGSAAVRLPRALGVTERDSEVVATAPSRFELRGSVRAWERSKITTWVVPLDPVADGRDTRVRASSERPPAVADLTWRLAPDAVLARAVTDVEIDGNVQQVTQLLTLTFSGRRPERVRLTSDRPIAALRVSPGTVEAAGGGWDLLLPSGLDREATFRLTFTAPADEANPAAIGVAYLRTDGPSADHVVRVWDRAGRVLALPDRSVVWREAPVEVVSDRASLPAIVVRANGLAGRLVLAIRSAGGDRAALWQVNRAQLEVRVANGHTVDVRAVFWVRPVAGREAVFELPESAGDAEVRVAGKLAAARPADTRPWRVPLPGNVPVPIPVEIRYRVDAGPGGRLVPPRLVGAVYDSVRWSVVAPPGRVPLVVGGSVPGAWSYRALFAALGISAGPTVSDADGTTADDFTSDGEPGGSGRRVTVWQDQPEPIRVAVVPYPAWFAGCSAATLLAGLALISFHRRVRTVAALLWCVVVAVTVQAASQPVSQALVAAVPGALALLLTVILYRLARGRHRRRLSRLPGFARSDSSLVRPSAVRPRDTTTIDAVAAERPASGVPSLR